MTYKCPRCSTRVKDWSGDDPKCGFDEYGNFLEHNWNCATLNALRDMDGKETWCDNNYVKGNGGKHLLGQVIKSIAPKTWDIVGPNGLKILAWDIEEIYGEGAYEIKTKSTFDEPPTA